MTVTFKINVQNSYDNYHEKHMKVCLFQQILLLLLII